MERRSRRAELAFFNRASVSDPTKLASVSTSLRAVRRYEKPKTRKADSLVQAWMHQMRPSLVYLATVRVLPLLSSRAPSSSASPIRSMISSSPSAVSTLSPISSSIQSPPASSSQSLGTWRGRDRLRWGGRRRGLPDLDLGAARGGLDEADERSGETDVGRRGAGLGGGSVHQKTG